MGSPVRSVLAHPGMATTPMQQSVDFAAERLLAKAMGLLVARPADQGVLPILYATAAPEAGVFIGPAGPKRGAKIMQDEFAGPATDARMASRLWGVSEELTGVRYLEA